MGAKRILALGSVAALCAGAAAPLLVASEASAAPIAHTICMNNGPSPAVDTEVLGINNTDLACAGLGGHNYTFDNAPVGPVGAAGPTGVTGPTGPQGATGAVGPAGDVGANGNVGPQGPAGVTGAVGGTGPAGPVGNAGPAGIPGPSGPQGLIGGDGLQGPGGAVGGGGPQGPTGPVQPVTLVVGPVMGPLVGGGTFAGNFTVSSVATCPAGTSLLGGGGKVATGGGAEGALTSDYPNANSWVAGAVVTRAHAGGTISGQAYAFCQ